MQRKSNTFRPYKTLVYNGDVTGIKMDRDFNLLGLDIRRINPGGSGPAYLFDYKSVEDLIKITEGFGKEECSYSIQFNQPGWWRKVEDNGKYKLIYVEAGVGMLKHLLENNEIEIYMDEYLPHPLHEKYGTDGLELVKIIYLSKSDNYGVTTYSIEKAIFKDKSNNILELFGKELFYQLLIIDKRVSISEKFYKNSCIWYMKLKNKIPVFTIKNDELSRAKADKTSKLYNVEFEESVNCNQIEQWINKLALAGLDHYKIDYSGLTLKELTTTENTITIPNFLYIDSSAFAKSTLKKVIITSPSTVCIKNSSDYFSCANKFGEEGIIAYKNNEVTSLDAKMQDDWFGLYLSAMASAGNI